MSARKGGRGAAAGEVDTASIPGEGEKGGRGGDAGGMQR